MEKQIEHEVITALAEKDINLTIQTNKDGYKVCCIANPDNLDLMEMYEFPGLTMRAALRQMIHDPAFTGAIDSDLFLRLNAAEQPIEPTEVIDTLSIMNPYLRDLRTNLDKAIQSAADAVDCDDTATITAKLVLREDPNAPDFENDAKLFAKAKYDVSVSIKREVNKYSGSVQAFGTRIVDGRMLMIDPDRQISLDEAIQQAEQEVGNVPPEKDLMADAPVDPQTHDEDFPEPDGEPDEDEDDNDNDSEDTEENPI